MLHQFLISNYKYYKKREIVQLVIRERLKKVDLMKSRLLILVPNTYRSPTGKSTKNPLGKQYANITLLIKILYRYQYSISNRILD